MRKLYLILFILFGSLLSVYSTTITAVQNNGFWNSASTWDLNRIPKSGDTIVIPQNLTIRVNNWNLLTGVLIRVYGTLRLQNGRLGLYSTSQVIVYRTGRITGNAADNINIAGVQKFLGSDGDVTGSKIANTSTGVNPNGFEPFVTAPVKFSGFYAKISGQVVQLSWTTTEEVNNSHFEIQRSNDGRNWINIAQIGAVSNPSQVNQYSYTDKHTISGTIYYRLKQVDKDGQAAYSTIKAVKIDSASVLANVYVSSKQTISIEFNEASAGKVIVRVSSVNGQAVKEQIFTEPAYRFHLEMPAAITGVYVVQVIRQGIATESKKLVL